MARRQQVDPQGDKQGTTQHRCSVVSIIKKANCQLRVASSERPRFRLVTTSLPGRTNMQ